MSLDTASEPSNASLSVRDAAALFGAEPQEPATQEAEPAKVEAEKPPEATQADPEAETVDEATAEPEKVTIEVDGKTVELTKAELADAYKNGLRQADYTKKTMEAAEQRKAAEAESSKAREERQKYAQGLQQANASLMAALQEQEKIDWDALIQQDPQEYLKQKHLYDRRQAQLQQNFQQGQQLAAQDRAEAKKSLSNRLQTEHQALLDKLPEWKDEGKAKAEQQSIAKELVDRGFDAKLIFGERDEDGSPKLENPGLTDHRILLMARDAMLYRQTMSKAQAAAKKVSQLPQKVERPGGGDTNPTDGRTVAMKRLAKSGSVLDAGKALESFFK